MKKLTEKISKNPILGFSQALVLGFGLLLFLVLRPYSEVAIIDPFTYIEANVGSISRDYYGIGYKEPLLDFLIVLVYSVVDNQRAVFVVISALFVVLMFYYSCYAKYSRYAGLVFLYVALNPSAFVLYCNLWRQGLACLFMVALITISQATPYFKILKVILSFAATFSHFTAAPFVVAIFFLKEIKKLKISTAIAFALLSFLFSRYLSDTVGAFMIANIDGYKNVETTETVRRLILLSYFIVYLFAAYPKHLGDLCISAVLVFSVLGVEQDALFGRLCHYPFIVICLQILRLDLSGIKLIILPAIFLCNIVILNQSATFLRMVEWSYVVNW